ncbi:MAG: radical SAM protein [Promethearchaeota archaeon]
MIFHITADSKIPLYGFDFIGVIDRGTNLIEIKPTTLCNLNCTFCYADAGNYINDFVVDFDYLIFGIKALLDFKKLRDVEAHIDPYGEPLLYNELPALIERLKGMDQIYRISMQTNGTLLDADNIHLLKEVGLDQINITLNAMDQDLLKRLAGNDNINRDKLLWAIEHAVEWGIDVVITPVWFFKLNDQEIENIIKHYIYLRGKFQDINAIRIGIQNYLEYKTGRKLAKVKSREFGYFYKCLRKLEKKYHVKLLLGPKDFNIHPARLWSPKIQMPYLANKKNKKQSININVLHQGRKKLEFLGEHGGWGVKILNFSPRMLGKTVKLPISNLILKGSLITAHVKG